MKHVQNLTLLALAISIAACQQDPASSSRDANLTYSSPSTPAHPALVYTGSTTSHGSTYQTVAVCDTDGGHQTNIYTALTAGAPFLGCPSWSADGSKISFIESGVVKSIAFSVVNGVPKGGTVTTLCSATGGANSAYSAVSSTNKVAYQQNAGSTHSIYVVSGSGGTPVLLYSSSGNLAECTWSPDDSKIAFVDRGDGSGWHSTIHVIDASTGAQTDSLPLSYFAIMGIELSRSGLNQLAICTIDTNNGPSGPMLRYVTPTTGSTATAGTAGTNPTWSPNNSSLLLHNATGSGYYQKTTAFSTSSSSVTGIPLVVRLRWKR